MQKILDKIQFEYRSEIQELINVIEKYVDAYPKEKDNNTVKEFYDLLDAMDMEW